MAKPARSVLTLLVVLLLAAAAYAVWQSTRTRPLPEGIASGNGRIEATEVDVAALAGGRITAILASEGQTVKAGDVLVEMDTDQLKAQERQAEAALRRARIGVDTAGSGVDQAIAQRAAAEAQVEQAQAVADAARMRLARSEQLSKSSTVSQQVLDDDRANERQARAGLALARASLAAADAGIGAARARVVDAEAAVEAAQAAIDAITTSIGDMSLRAPRSGRVQYQIAEVGEVVAPGGRILNIVVLDDVYMTFFLPTSQAGRVQIGQEVRLILDAAPDIAIPASVSYVADVAQFTPKTVETTVEREKLMFRVKAQVRPALLEKYIDYVKTGLPGSAYLRIDPKAEWPATLAKVAQ